MSTTTRDDLTKLLEEFSHADTPEIAARDEDIVDLLLRIRARRHRQEGRREGYLTATRAALRRVLTRRGWVLDAATDARIEACADLDTLARWLEQAVTAANMDEALR